MGVPWRPVANPDPTQAHTHLSTGQGRWGWPLRKREGTCHHPAQHPWTSFPLAAAHQGSLCLFSRIEDPLTGYSAFCQEEQWSSFCPLACKIAGWRSQKLLRWFPYAQCHLLGGRRSDPGAALRWAQARNHILGKPLSPDSPTGKSQLPCLLPLASQTVSHTRSGYPPVCPGFLSPNSLLYIVVAWGWIHIQAWRQRLRVGASGHVAPRAEDDVCPSVMPDQARQGAGSHRVWPITGLEGSLQGCAASSQRTGCQATGPGPFQSQLQLKLGGVKQSVPPIMNSARKSGGSEPHSRAGKRGKRPLRLPTTPTLWMGKLRPRNRVHHTKLLHKKS